MFGARSMRIDGPAVKVIVETSHCGVSLVSYCEVFFELLRQLHSIECFPLFLPQGVIGRLYLFCEEVGRPILVPLQTIIPHY